ncbi:LysR family transcriptional regulator [Martelella alba]|uniref:LysR family transcriptional regulator n=1 Tax=Martelella alba TaxID=2590451 RepID=A0A506UEB1_9HYPH|nr:LysR family transcriptional regulator [Martelella alba]TPW31756.1 LysR family transcriptional regulator [Martelella alba]
MSELSWDHYRTLLAVLEKGSLSAAARELALTQPTIGRHVAALEAAAGQPLFTRSQQGLQPTEIALSMKPLAEAMAATASALGRAASQQAGQVSGTVRISVSEVIGVEVLPAVLEPLLAAHPALEVELSISDSVEDLLLRKADIALRMIEPTQEALRMRFAGRIGIGCFAHRRYLERHGIPQGFDDLARHTVIGFDRELSYVRDSMRAFPDIAMPHFRIRTDSNLAQLAAIRAGLGIGLCQLQLGRREKDLVEVIEGAIPLTLPVYIAMHEDLRHSPRCRATFDALYAGMRAYIGEDDQSDRSGM